MPGVKPTKAEHRKRLELVRNLLGRGLYDGEIKAIVGKRYGIKFRTVQRYLARAREDIRRETGRDFETLRGEAYETYRSIVSDQDAKPIERIKARERIDRLMGLEAPTKVAPTTVAGEDLPPVQSQAAAIAQGLLDDPSYVEYLRSRAAGEGDSDSGAVGE